MTHTTHCADAKTSPAQCRCECAGKSHGAGYASWLKVATESDQVGPGHQPIPNRLGPATTQALDIIGSRRPRPMSDLVREIRRTLEASEVDAVLAAPLPSGQRRRPAHWLCTLLLDLADAIERLQRLPDELVDIVDDWMRRWGWDLPYRVLVTAIVRRVVAVPLGGFISSLEPIVIKLRIAGVLACPSPPRHKSVERAAESVANAVATRAGQSAEEPSALSIV